MNIRVGSLEQIKANIPLPDLVKDPIVIRQMQEMALASINGNQNNFIHAYILDNYSYIVYNFIKNGGQLTEKDNCPFKGFDLKKLWNESEQRGLPKFQNPVKPNFKNIKQYTRLTIICDDPKVVHQIINLSSGEKKHLSIINSYDLLGVRTSESEQLFDQCCTKSDVDIISLDMSQRMSFFLQKPLIKQAIQRGIQFEICYGSLCFEGSQANRKQFLQNCMQLAKVTKGKNIILSSEVTNSIYQRTPLDCIQMQEIKGIIILKGFNVWNPIERSIASDEQNSQMAFKHAHMRKTYKGVAELIIKQGEEEEEEKMQD